MVRVESAAAMDGFQCFELESRKWMGFNAWECLC